MTKDRAEREREIAETFGMDPRHPMIVQAVEIERGERNADGGWLTEWAVMGETDAGTIIIKRRFDSKESAEGHPIEMKYWKRVWVEKLGTLVINPPEPPPGLPPLPWDWQTSARTTNNMISHVYLTDAAGKKIAAIWGRPCDRQFIADFILEAVGAYAKANPQRVAAPGVAETISTADSGPGCSGSDSAEAAGSGD